MKKGSPTCNSACRPAGSDFLSICRGQKRVHDPCGRSFCLRRDYSYTRDALPKSRRQKPPMANEYKAEIGGADLRCQPLGLLHIPDPQKFEYFLS